MKFIKEGLGTLLVAGMCGATLSAQAVLICPTPICSVYENLYPDLYLTEEALITSADQASKKQKEVKYTKTLGTMSGKGLKPVPGVGKKYKKHNEIIAQMQEGAGNGANIIAQSTVQIDGIDNLGDYSVAKSDINNQLTVRPYAERNGKNYTTAELDKILENQRTALNDYAANAIAMGATETVNAAGAAAESDPEDRAKQIAKADTLAELYELMLGMDRRIYERSLHASAVEAANAGVDALRVLSGVSTTSSGQ
ncbi:MAG: hypothetical protein SPL08_04620 [Pseudomonadota bacterium]|nr:hypothetical protein [Pseudomonadota bacterium]